MPLRTAADARKRDTVRNLDEPLVAIPVHPEIVCIGCRYSHGEPPFADLPKKAYCKIYRREDGVEKPSEVYFDGKPCEFREEDRR